jgi:hypothetical protein
LRPPRARSPDAAGAIDFSNVAPFVGTVARFMGTRCAATLAVFLAVSGALSACGGSSKSAGVQGRSEVTAEPVSSAGANPFTAAAGSDTAGVKPPAATTTAAKGPATYSGSMPGLYGGTRNHHSCDAEKLISFLEQNPGKAAAWAQTLGISTTQIRDYVTRLTAVILRTDTRVTNHGYVNGRATPLQAVLEAGTAVLVDRYGRPVVKCYCGNPLTPPELLTSPTYTGDRWSDFDTAHLTIIDRSTTIINVFEIYDLDTGRTFPRTPGANGTDGPFAGTPSSGTTTPAPAPTPQPAAPPTHTGTEPSSNCPPGEVPDSSSSDGCSPQTGSDGTTTPVCPDAGPAVCGDTSNGTSTHGSNGSPGSSGQSP